MNLTYHPRSLSALPIHVSEAMIEQHRKPKSKKRRIRNKWAKRPENWRPMRGAVEMGGAIYMHPQTEEAMRRQLGEEMAARVEAQI